MPTFLSPQCHIQDVEVWLNTNFNQPNVAFTPHASVINSVPYRKGIYFWFMHPDGYQDLSRYISIVPIEYGFKKEINEIMYDLVYLGTSGTGKQGGSNLRKRLLWHIQDKHTQNSICHGTLSTLRAGLGALLKNNLIEPDTESAVNEFMKDKMALIWIAYDENEESMIDRNEKTLIQTLKPLLNIKNNPNARANATENETREYKLRRTKVYTNSKNLINCKPETEKVRKSAPKPTDSAPSYKYQVLDSDECCVSFYVLNNQSIAEVVRGVEGLPVGSCRVRCTDSANPNQIIYAKQNGDGWRKTGTGKQNIYTYFANVDTGNNNTCRWELIQKEMIDKNVSEITVTVCAEGGSRKVKVTETSSSLQNGKGGDIEKNLDRKMLSDNKKSKLLIFGCSDSKTIGGNIIPNPKLYFDQYIHNDYVNSANANLQLYEQLLVEEPAYFTTGI